MRQEFRPIPTTTLEVRWAEDDSGSCGARVEPLREAAAPVKEGCHSKTSSPRGSAAGSGCHIPPGPIAIDLAGAIGQQVLAHPLPARRTRTEDRIVKRAICRYNARPGPNINRTTNKSPIRVDVPHTDL